MEFVSLIWVGMQRKVVDMSLLVRLKVIVYIRAAM
jgi:hypothetical protein